ncbi:MAG: radical SAM family heme chaperone HemW [Alicyclobacillus macrosporangiidus]|uniref:radical SAM family heme chaperone HemW n=1 Tax=Alicyclobacillus macrosporangiidus TaxID=392015 RepID=UPI0026F2C4DC|nr:radical SAM family heme chaperone HemW [Alicyclobacillus macrosporangiidus]MCL6599962.1 radical SAM family heme chaperone HemW [Alicyclobacillus macrosporangiidus]
MDENVGGLADVLRGHPVVRGRLVDTLHTAVPTSLYVHIPFCASRCHYCDFTTYVAPRPAMDAYVAALAEEFRLLGAEATAPLQTVFFGGGTPTLLSARQLDQVFAALHRCFRLAEGVEVTVEANPGTVDEEKLALLREAGVNRLSFGAQTFNERLLLAIGRLHDAGTIRRSVAMAQDVGFTNLNLDLMFGLPDQTLEDVRESVREVVRLGVSHVSAYWLKVEPGTPFARWRDEGLLSLPGEDLEADMYDLVRDELAAAGFVHYEVSNFARPGCEARHNLVYWHNEPYWAAGVGVHGYAFGRRYENVRGLQEYAAQVQAGRRPWGAAHEVSAAESAEDTLMLGLRLREGVSAERFLARHGVRMEEAFAGVIDPLAGQGLLTWRGDRLRLTERAWPVANVVFERFVGALTLDEATLDVN